MDANLIKEKIINKEVAVIFPKGQKTEAAAKQLADSLDSAIGIAEFINDGEEKYYGVLINELKKDQENEETLKAEDSDDSNVQNETMLLS